MYKAHSIFSVETFRLLVICNRIYLILYSIRSLIACFSFYLIIIFQSNSSNDDLDSKKNKFHLRNISLFPLTDAFSLAFPVMLQSLRDIERIFH